MVVVFFVVCFMVKNTMVASRKMKLSLHEALHADADAGTANAGSYKVSAELEAGLIKLPNDMRLKLTLLVKIYVNYGQLVGFARDIMEWPRNIDVTFTAISSIANVPIQIAQVDCVLSGDGGYTPDQYYRIWGFIMALPVVLFLIHPTITKKTFEFHQQRALDQLCEMGD